MEKIKKTLKEASILILVLCGLTLIKNIVNVCVNGFTVASQLPGLAADLVEITAIITFVISLLFLLPEIYVGVKGLKMANGAASGKAPIVWAIILAILAGISAISAISGLTKGINVDSILPVIDAGLDLFAYIYFIIYARKYLQAK